MFVNGGGIQVQRLHEGSHVLVRIGERVAQEIEEIFGLRQITTREGWNWRKQGVVIAVQQPLELLDGAVASEGQLQHPWVEVRKHEGSLIEEHVRFVVVYQDLESVVHLQTDVAKQVELGVRDAPRQHMDDSLVHNSVFRVRKLHRAVIVQETHTVLLDERAAHGRNLRDFGLRRRENPLPTRLKEKPQLSISQPMTP